MTGPLLMVGVGRMGRPYVAAAERLGIEVHAVEATSRADALPAWITRVERTDVESDEAWAAAAWRAAAACRPSGVVAFSEVHVLAAALLQDELALPGPSLHAATLSRNKALQRGSFGAAGLPQPEFVVGEDRDALAAWADGRHPVVVKALSSAGSDGVELARTADELRRVLARRTDRRLLLEAALAGDEVSWEAVVVDGHVVLENVTAKTTTGAPHFVEVAHRTGVRLPEAQAAAVAAVAAGVVAALRVRTGMVHLELILTPDGPAVVEVAVRTPGDFLMDLVGWTTGTDVYEALVRAATGLPVEPPPPGPVAYAGSWFPLASGTVVAVEGLEEARAHPDVVEVEVRARPGDVLPEVTSSADRTGHVLVRARTPEARDAALAHAERHVRIVTDRG